MDKDIAAQVTQLMIKYFAELNASIKLVQENCTREEFENYRKAVASLMGNMSADIMIPIFREHPDLEPQGFKH